VSDSPKNTVGPRKRRTPYSPTSLSIDDFQKISEIFKAWIDSSNLKWWIIAAGVGAVLEALHIIWLAARYIIRF